MNYWMLEWDHKDFSWDRYEKDASFVHGEGILCGNWITKTKAMRPGDRFVLMRTNADFLSGIMGYGTIEGYPETLITADGVKKKTVPICIFHLSPTKVKTLISSRELNEKFPEEQWNQEEPLTEGVVREMIRCFGRW